MNKYGNKKVEYQGMKFDSKKELNRYLILSSNDEVCNLQRQVKYVLIPKIGKQRECSYIADFVYSINGEVIVEDCKGYRTDAYKIKKKLMKWVHNIDIQET